MKNTPTRRVLLTTTLAGAGAIAARDSAAQTRWVMASPYPEANFHTRNIRAFIEDIERATQGRLAIQLHHGATLLPMPQIKRGVQQG